MIVGLNEHKGLMCKNILCDVAQERKSVYFDPYKNTFSFILCESGCKGDKNKIKINLTSIIYSGITINER